MELTRYFSSDQILLGVKVRDKWELLDRMVEAIKTGKVCKRQDEDVKNRIHADIIAREKTSSTGFGDGFAFPHARVEGFVGFAFCMAVLDEPLEYGAMDNKPVQIACMAITPENTPGIGLKAMGVIACLLGDPKVKEYFLSQNNPREVFDFIDNKGLRLDSSITAENIMRTPILDVNTTTPLRQVTKSMMKNRIETVPVLDDSEKVVGEITCNGLFKRGIPDFFSQLASVAFIRDFDPFEAYFEKEAHSTAADIMSTDYATVETTSTMMEIIYLLAVRNYSKIYVLNNGKLVGIIDRIAVLDKVLNL